MVFKDPFADDPPIRRAAPAPAPVVNDTSSFGEAGTDPLAVKAPTTPAPAPAPVDHGATAVKTANINAAPGGYNEQRAASNADALDLNTRIAGTAAGRAGVEVPFLGSGSDNPIKNTVNTAFETIVGSPLHAGQTAIDDPWLTLASGGANIGIGATDRAVDLVGSGIARDVSGDDNATIDAPLTPGQLYDPTGPLYKDSDTTIQQPGVKQIGEAIGDGAEWLGEKAVEGYDALKDAFDFSGNGAGGLGGGLGGAGGALGSGLTSAQGARDLGAGVMSGNAMAPNPADLAAQQNVLGSVGNFAGGPRAVDPLMAEFSQFMQQPEGPSKAQLLLDQASQGAMSDVLSASRSARSRSAGDQARQAAVAQGEIAGMGVDNARNAALLRQQEAQDFIGQQLKALEGKSGLATARDSNTLGALGVGGDLASSMRNAGVAERGDTLGFGQGMEQIAAGLEGDVIQTIPGLEAVRHDDQYELTPEQKLKVALLGGVGDVFSMFG
jgi:hypothetical protein